MVGRVAAVLCLLAAPLAAQAQGPTLVEPAIDLRHRGEVADALAVVVGETIVLRMPVQGGTGFGWSEAGGGGAALARLPYACPEPPGTAPGMLQHVCFEYAARAPGGQRVALDYARPWETGVAPAIRYVLDVEVTARP